MKKVDIKRIFQGAKRGTVTRGLPVRVSGIYGLFSRSRKLLYIGVSRSIRNRIFNHLREREFDHFRFVKMPYVQAASIEAKVLRYARPPFNLTTSNRNLQLSPGKKRFTGRFMMRMDPADEREYYHLAKQEGRQLSNYITHVLRFHHRRRMSNE